MVAYAVWVNEVKPREACRLLSGVVSVRPITVLVHGADVFLAEPASVAGSFSCFCGLYASKGLDWDLLPAENGPPQC